MSLSVNQPGKYGGDNGDRPFGTCGDNRDRPFGLTAPRGRGEVLTCPELLTCPCCCCWACSAIRMHKVLVVRRLEQVQKFGSPLEVLGMFMKVWLETMAMRRPNVNVGIVHGLSQEIKPVGSMHYGVNPGRCSEESVAATHHGKSRVY